MCCWRCPSGCSRSARCCCSRAAAIAPSFGLAYGLVEGAAPPGAVTEAYTWLTTGLAARDRGRRRAGGRAGRGPGAGGGFVVAAGGAAGAALARARRATIGDRGAPAFVRPDRTTARHRRQRRTARMIVRATRRELGERDGLVDRVRELDPGRADHHRRDAARREQAHVGAPRHAGERRLARRARRAARRARVATHGWSGGRLAGRERAALPDELARRLAVVERRVDDRLQRGAGVVEARADRHAEPALELDPVRDLARPVAAAHPADEQRVGQLAARASAGASTSALTRASWAASAGCTRT